MDTKSNTKRSDFDDTMREHRLLALLRTSAFVAVLVGAAGSVGLMLWEGRRNDSRILLALFALWVLSPFMALGLACVASRRWSVVSRAIFHGVNLVITLTTLAIYGNAVVGPSRAKPVFMFIVVPPVTWLLMAIVVPVGALISGKVFRTGFDRRIFKDFAILDTLGILAIGTMLGLLWLEHTSDLVLPTPTGPYAVGRAIYDWADDEQLDTLAAVLGTKRELLVWIWYPAAGQSVAVDDYVPASLRASDAPQPASLSSSILDLLTRDLSKVHSHSILNADVSPKQRAFPVVIIRTGASLSVLTYSTLVEDLASHGYIVVGFDAPFRTARVVFPDGRVIARTPENNPELYEGQPHADRLNKLLSAWTADIGFVLDRLEQLNASDPSGKFMGRLDMTRVGVFGHSFGGAQAAQFCSQDSRCKAGIDVDGRPLGSVIQTGIQKPFMFLLSDHSSSDPETRQIEADIQSIYDRLPADRRLRIVIHGANHFTFNDDGALMKSRAIRGLLHVFGKLGIDGRRQLEITAYCVHSFFDAYLNGPAVLAPEFSSTAYPEIQVIE